MTSAADGQIISLDSILLKLEETLTDNDYKDNTFSKVRKRKNEREEKLFLARVGVLMRHLVDFKGERSMVHIFHLRFIHTAQHIKKIRQTKIIAQLTEYLRIMNKHYSQPSSSSSSSSSNYNGNDDYNSNGNNNMSSPPIIYDSPIIDSNTASPYIQSIFKDNFNIDGSNQNNNAMTSSSSNSNNNNPNGNLTTSSSSTASNTQSSTLNVSNNFRSNNTSPLISPVATSPTITPPYQSGSLTNSQQQQQQQQQNSQFQQLQPQQQSEVKVARELLDYLLSHRVDPDNSLVGCELNTSYIDGIFKFKSQHSFNKRSLIKMIKNWGSLKDDTLVKEVRKMSTTLNSLDFKKGELIIVDINQSNQQQQQQTQSSSKDEADVDDDFDFGDTNSNISVPISGLAMLDESIELNQNSVYKFARFSEEFGRTCKVYLYPSEDNRTLLPINNVYKLSPEILEQIRVERSVKLVTDPSVSLNHSLNYKEKDILNNYLTNICQLDTIIIEKCRTNTLQLTDLPMMRKCIQDCADLDRSLASSKLLQEILQLAKTESKPFIEMVRKSCIYIPLWNQIEELVKNIENDREKKFRARLHQHIISLESASFKLQVEKKEIADGVTKNKLSQWWLSIIREHVESFLFKSGFDFNAVPQDYMSQAPNNYNGVKTNLHILHCIMEKPSLSTSTSTPSTTPSTTTTTTEENTIQKEFGKILTRLIDTIYPGIEDFILKSKLVILDLLDMFEEPVTSLQSKGLLEMTNLKQLISSRKEIIEKPKYQQLDRLCKDIDYILEMKSLENNLIEKRLDIVPITGLALGRIHRLENEMRTVIEIWGKQYENNITVTNVQQSPNESPSNSFLNGSIGSNNNSNSSSGGERPISPLNVYGSNLNIANTIQQSMLSVPSKSLTAELVINHSPPQKPLPATPPTSSSSSSSSSSHQKKASSSSLKDLSVLANNNGFHNGNSTISSLSLDQSNNVSVSTTPSKKWNEPSKPFNRLLPSQRLKNSFLHGSGGNIQNQQQQQQQPQSNTKQQSNLLKSQNEEQ